MGEKRFYNYFRKNELDDLISKTNFKIDKFLYENGSKDNQKDLKDDIKTYFDLGIKRDDTNIIIWDTDYEKDHGRIEKRVYYLSYEIDCISDKTK